VVCGCLGHSITYILVAMQLLLAGSLEKSETLVDEGSQPNWDT
jgi:hypothetical protein